MKIVDSNILKKSLADEGRAPDLVLLLWIIYMVCKTALGIVWIWEGLVPKILFPSVEEIEMVARTRLAWWDPASFIPFLGVWEVALGLLLLMGIRPRIMASLSLGLLLFFTLVLPFYEPSLLYHPYGAITKNLGLLSCSFVVILLAPHVSKSANILTKPLSLLFLGILAFAGSAIYGTSLSLLFPRWSVSSGSLWIILSAGIGWFVLWGGTFLLHGKKVNMISFIAVSLAVMRYGIVVLLFASLVNLFFYSWGLESGLTLIILNILMVVISNIIMGYVFVQKLKEQSLTVKQSLLLWMVFLNGAGAVLFTIFWRVLP
ncbi:DoxX-like family protein [Caldalkalibacillus mannanilyticus]|uniref:DoxX-like family protein n=1 Tax=Caldalkalibacillus mannanilyticus TaxID=1418 RepID=UPI00068551DE|nr:DoxX-like family protein [Caldalkalibacillus mannanilyticus]